MTDQGALAQLAAVEAFTAWLKVDTENHPADRLLDISYESAPVSRGNIEALLEGVRAMAGIAADRYADLSQARELARIMYRALNAQPTDLGDYDERLKFDALPEWLSGGV